MSEVNLNLYDVGVCYVKDWCSDSKKLDSELKSQPLKILFLDYNSNAIYQYNSIKKKFLNTRQIHKYIEVDHNMPSHVPLLYLINKTTQKYDGLTTFMTGHDFFLMLRLSKENHNPFEIYS